MEARPPRDIAICIVTHRRPEGLRRLLGGLEALDLSGTDARVRIVVIDNDPAGSALPVCDEAAARRAFRVDYAIEKRRGIPQARNAALAAAAGADFVAFVDDDEVPEPGWLAELLRVQAETAADAVTGPCLPRFEREPPTWVVEGGFFERPRHPTGARLDQAFTHNVLIRLAALAEMDRLFDESMALSGGSDVEFFRRFALGGHGIVWADRALVHEIVPESRATLRWVLRRAWRIGTTSAFVRRLHRPGAATALHLLVHGRWCLAKAGGLLLLASLRGRAAAARALHLGCVGAGRLAGLLGVRFEEYQSTDGS